MVFSRKFPYQFFPCRSQGICRPSPTMNADPNRLTPGIQLLSVVMLLIAAVPIDAQDWPQWNGPDRDGVLRSANVVLDFPRDATPVWKVEGGIGFSGPVVVGDRVFITDYVLQSGTITNNAGKRDELQGRERIRCLDAKTGDVIWQHDYDRPYKISYPGGPRATPTVHEGKVYCLGSEGDLLCLNTEDGEVVWRVNFSNQFGAQTPLWGHAASPLVYRDRLICMVGGDDSLVVAFHLQTGAVKWKSLSSDKNETGYCPPTIVKAGGVDQLMIWDPKVLHSLNPNTGDEYWRETVAPGYGMSILPPISDGRLLFVSGESRTSAMFRLDADKPAAELLWRGGPKDSLYLATSNAIWDDGHIFGADISSGALVGFEAESGKRKWQSALPTTGSPRGRGAAHGSAFLIRCSNGYLILSETGDLVHAKLSRDGYKEISRFHALKPTTKTMGRDVVWTYPALSGKHVYVRNDQEIACFRVASER